MSNLDRNSYAADAPVSMKAARNAGFPHEGEAAYLLQEAQVEATLALAYEQRTANLIAYLRTIDDQTNIRERCAEIAVRVGHPKP